MAFANALGGSQWLDPAILLRMIGAANGNDTQTFGGGANPDGTMSLAGDPNTAMLGEMPVAPRKQKGLGFRNVLGIIGDSILQGHGRQPIYGPLHEKKQIQGALQNFLTDPDGAIQALMEVDAPAAISLYRTVHPANEVPAAMKEWQAYQGMSPEDRAQFLKFRQSLSPQIMSPITLGPNDTYEAPGGAPADSVPTINSQAEYDALPPGARYRDSQGNPGIKRGGATASPSQTFP